MLNFKNLLNKIAFLLLISNPALLSADGSKAKSDFCSLSGKELLSQLDGSWTVKQGPTVAQGGPIAFPLPAPPATSVTLKYDAKDGIAELQGAEFDEHMIMFPTAKSQLKEIKEFLSKKPSDAASTCSWSSAPPLIGTNYYLAFGEEFIAATKKFDYCKKVKSERNDPNSMNSTDVMKKWYSKNCGDSRPSAPFEMEMTLAIKFTSATSGSGRIHFKGSQDDVNFIAIAPIKFTRG